jgi:hypothetical protein
VRMLSLSLSLYLSGLSSTFDALFSSAGGKVGCLLHQTRLRRLSATLRRNTTTICSL